MKFFKKNKKTDEEKQLEEKREYIDKYLDILDIKNGILHRKGFYTVFVEVKGLNYDLFTEEEQEDLIAGYQNVVDNTSLRQTVVMVNETIDTTKYLDEIDMIESRIDVNSANEREQIDLLDEYKKLAIDISSSDYTQRNYYVALTSSDNKEISSFLREVNDYVESLNSLGLVKNIRNPYISTNQIIDLHHNLINPSETHLLDFKRGGF